MNKLREQFLIRLAMKLCDRIEKNLKHIVSEIEKKNEQKG